MARLLFSMFLLAFWAKVALGVDWNMGDLAPPPRVLCRVWDRDTRRTVQRYRSRDAIETAMGAGLQFFLDPEAENNYPKRWNRGPKGRCTGREVFEYPIYSERRGWPGPYRALFSITYPLGQNDDFILDYCGTVSHDDRTTHHDFCDPVW